jgi:hypothetical protein
VAIPEQGRVNPSKEGVEIRRWFPFHRIGNSGGSPSEASFDRGTIRRGGM